MPDGLVEFLNRRLDEEGRVARAVTGTLSPEDARRLHYDRARGVYGETLTDHPAAIDPEATLTRTEALRAVVDLHRLVPAYGYRDGASGCRSCDTDEVGHVQPSPWRGDYCPTLRAFGAAYRSHPEYREEWALQEDTTDA